MKAFTLKPLAIGLSALALGISSSVTVAGKGGASNKDDSIKVSGRADWGIESTHVVSAVKNKSGSKGTILQVFTFEGQPVHLIANVKCMNVVGDTGYAVGVITNAINSELFGYGNLKGGTLEIYVKKNDDVSKFSDVYFGEQGEDAIARCNLIEERGGPQGDFVQGLIDESIVNVNGTVMLNDGD